MACKMKPGCGFLFGFLWCSLPRDTIDVELTVQMVQGIHTSRKDHAVGTATCSPWSRHVKPFPPLQKKAKAYEEDKRDKTAGSAPILSK